MTGFVFDDMRGRLAAGLVLAVLGVTAEWVALSWLLASSAETGFVLSVALASHVVATICLAFTLYSWLPARHRTVAGLGVIAVTVFCLSLLGALGLGIAVLPALHWPREEDATPWQNLPMPELPSQPVDIDTQDVFLRDGLSSVLSHFDDTSRRQHAIIACAHLPNRQAVPLLQQGLGDPDDEVRLLAFSKLDAIESDLEQQLTAASERAESLPDQYGRYHERVATVAWEFSFLGLVHDSVEQILLTRAIASVTEAIQRRSSVQRWFLKARCYIALDRLAEAEEALNKAERLGLGRDNAAPRRAEIAFRRGSFDAIPGWLNMMSADARRAPVMQSVVAYWQ